MSMWEDISIENLIQKMRKLAEIFDFEITGERELDNKVDEHSREIYQFEIYHGNGTYINVVIREITDVLNKKYYVAEVMKK